MEKEIKREFKSQVLMTNIVNSISKARVIDFAVEHLGEVMNMVGVTNYAIGGSVAAMLYGVDYGRVPHDIDVIVPLGTMQAVVNAVNQSIFFVADRESSCDAEFKTNHFAFRTMKGYSIDIIESADFYEGIYNGFGNPRLMHPTHLIESKKKYNRWKDIEDLKKLKEFFKIEDEPKPAPAPKNQLGDIDALAALKAKMEQGL